MQEHTLDGLLGRPLVVDLCEPCQSFWFDGRESLQLSPAATLVGHDRNTTGRIP